jgi:thiosulfate/3-mercaptopyruvate sulfurtransferase
MRALRSAFVALCCLAWSAVAQRATNPREPLFVTPQWLAAHLRDPNLVILHVGDPKKYETSHVPGARLMEMKDVSVSDLTGMEAMMPPDMPKPPLVGPKNGLTLEMPTAEQLRSQLEKFGISDDSRIVIVEADQWISPSTRIMFTLDYAGLGARTVMLDGGLAAWIREKNEVTTEVPAPPKPGKLSALSIKPLIVNAEYMRDHANTPGVSLIDARSASFYDGIPNSRGTPQRLGHIPGARSVPFNSFNDETGKLKPAEELRAVFAKAGVQPGDTIVAYCHVGQQATAVLFAARTLGHPVKLYDASFDDWNKRTDLPVVNPSATKKP